MKRWLTKRVGMFLHDEGANNIRGVATCALCAWRQIITSDLTAEESVENHVRLTHVGVLNGGGLQGTPYGNDAFEHFVHLNP